VPCEGGVPALGPEEARAYARQIPAWTLSASRIRRNFTLKDFRKALAWIFVLAKKIDELARADGLG
jgi:pterin-4a-carbinolamine dehydratase